MLIEGNKFRAAIAVGNPVGIPHEITLRFLTQHGRQDGYVVWRKENRMGVVFDSLESETLH